MDFITYKIRNVSLKSFYRHSSGEGVPTVLFHQSGLVKESFLISYGAAGKAEVTAAQLGLTWLQLLPG